MTRTIFAIAMALITATTFFSPAAKACISCEYVPPVVNTPVYSHTQTYTKRKSYTAVKQRRAKKHIATTPKAEKPERSKTAVAKPVQKPQVETASISNDEPETENSSIATAAVDIVEPKTEAKAKPAQDEQASNATTCKKFFASVGMTLTVPCQ